MALSADTPLTLDEGIINGLPAAAAKLYEGSMLGLDADGYAAALLAGYQFLGTVSSSATTRRVWPATRR